MPRLGGPITMEELPAVGAPHVHAGRLEPEVVTDGPEHPAHAGQSIDLWRAVRKGLGWRGRLAGRRKPSASRGRHRRSFAGITRHPGSGPPCTPAPTDCSQSRLPRPHWIEGGRSIRSETRRLASIVLW